MNKLTVKANEGGTYGINVAFTGLNAETFTPKTLEWTLSDLNGVIINSRDRVSVSPSGTSYLFIMSGADLEYDEEAADTERVFTVEGTFDATYGTDLPFRDQVQFSIVDMVIDAE
jgi:hypothetical protein